MMIRQVMIVCVLLTLVGCASTRNPMERELQYAIDAENWELCQRVYSHSSTNYLVSYHDHRDIHRHYEIESDLRVNQCRVVLGKYWITP